MRLDRVDVLRLRGGRTGFRLEGLAPGLNLVLGPNGSGKSSLCAALQSTLWPGLGVAGEAELVAWWVPDGGDGAGASTTAPLRAELRAVGRAGVASVDWQRDGAPASAPEVPDALVAPVYRLGVRDLLADDGAADQEVVDRIRVQMSGGFDVAAARSGPPARPGAAEEKALREARQARARLESERRVLAADADRLETLRAERAAAEAAQADLELLQAAVDAAGLRDEIAALDRALADLDAPLARLDALRGDEREALAALADERAEAQAEREAAERARTVLEEERRALGLEDGSSESAAPADDAARGVAEAAVRDLRDAEADRRAGLERLTAARHEWTAAAEALGGRADLDAVTALDASAIDRAAGWVARALRLATRRAELAGAIEALAPAAADGTALAAEADAVRRRADTLRDWLASPVPAPRPSSSGAVIALAFGLAGVAVVWALLPPSAIDPLLYALAGGLAGWSLARLLRGPEMRTDGRAEIERRWRDMPATGYAETDRVCTGLRFEPTLVREALQALDLRLADRLRAQREALAVEELRRSLARVEEEIAEAAADRAALAGRIGIDPGLGEVAFADLVERVRRAREADTRCARHAAEVEALEARVGSLRARLEGALPRAWSERADDVAGLIAVAEEWLDAGRHDASLARELRRSSEHLDAVDQRLARLDARRAAVLARAGLAADTSDAIAEPELARLLAERERLDGIRDTRRAATERLRALDLRLESRPDWAKLERPDAETRLAAARERARLVGGLAEEIARIEEHIEAAARSGELEAANAAVARAEAALAAARDALALDLAGEFLLDEVEAEYERDTRPALLREASGLLARFTGHRYGLEVARRGAGGFRAVETETGRGLALHELSDGTRMQLLLAARLAFALHAEGSQHPPIFLDEALTASDPERFRAVVEGLLELAAEGRQIFYLTCNPADVALFRSICTASGLAPPTTIDLGALRGRAESFDGPESLAVPAPPPVPAPGGETPEAYAARIGVPRPAPGEGVDALHLFHVLRDDLPTLHRLLDAGRIERVGHWRSLRASPAGARLLDPRTSERIDAAVAVAERYLDAWSIGRGRPVDRAVLEETGAVSDRYIDDLSELAREVDGDARALVAAIEDKRVTGFRSGKLDALREALEASGHLDPATPLDADAVRARALAGLPAATGPDRPAYGLADAQRLIDWLERLLGDEP